MFEKWNNVDLHTEHMDSTEMSKFANSVRHLLSEAPKVEMFDSISAHDQK